MGIVVDINLNGRYDAVQVGYRRVRDTKLTKPELGHLQKTGSIPMRHLQEFRLQSIDGFEPGQRLAIEEIFKEGDLVDVCGNSIGKGFQGALLIYFSMIAVDELIFLFHSTNALTIVLPPNERLRELNYHVH